MLNESLCIHEAIVVIACKKQNNFLWLLNWITFSSRKHIEQQKPFLLSLNIRHRFKPRMSMNRNTLAKNPNT